MYVLSRSLLNLKFLSDVFWCESVFIYYTGYSLLFPFGNSECKKFLFYSFFTLLFSVFSFWNSFYSNIGPPRLVFRFSFFCLLFLISLSFCFAFWEIFSTLASNPSIVFFISSITFLTSRSSFCFFCILNIPFLKILKHPVLVSWV